MSLYDSTTPIAFQPGAAITPMIDTANSASQAAYLPQKLYMDALMSKVNFAKATNPIDYALIQRALGGGVGAPPNFPQAPGPQIGPGQMMGPSPAAPQAPNPGILPMVAQQIAAQKGAAAPSGMSPPPSIASITPQMMMPQTPGAPPSQAPQGSAIGFENMVMPPFAAQAARRSMPATASPQELAQNVDLSAIPSTATEDLAKLAAQQYMWSHRGEVSAGLGAQAKMETNAATNETNKEIQAGHDQTRQETAGIIHGNKPDSALKDRAEVNKIINDSYGEYIKSPWMMSDPHAVSSLVDQIDSETDPQVKQAAIGRFKTVYNAYKVNHPTAPAAAAPSPAKRTTQAVTPEDEAKAESAVNQVDALLQNNWATPFSSDKNGMPLYLVPKDKLDQATAILKQKGASQAQIQRITTKYRVGPSTGR